MQLSYKATALFASAIHFTTGAAAVNCAVCPATITFQGAVRTLTLTREESGNTVQCNYDTPSIPGFSPTCLYRNVDGVLISTNTEGACPSPITLITKSLCMSSISPDIPFQA